MADFLLYRKKVAKRLRRKPIKMAWVDTRWFNLCQGIVTASDDIECTDRILDVARLGDCASRLKFSLWVVLMKLRQNSQALHRPLSEPWIKFSYYSFLSCLLNIFQKNTFLLVIFLLFFEAPEFCEVDIRLTYAVI